MQWRLHQLLRHHHACFCLYHPRLYVLASLQSAWASNLVLVLSLTLTLLIAAFNITCTDQTTDSTCIGNCRWNGGASTCRDAYCRELELGVSCCCCYWMLDAATNVRHVVTLTFAGARTVVARYVR